MSRTEPFTTEIPVRYRDQDPEGHVNNAVYGTYIEQARTAYIEHVLDSSIEECDVVIAHLSIDYRQPVTLADESVEITVQADEPGRSSISMQFELRTADGVVTTGTSVMVTVDSNGDSRPLPEAWRDRISSYEADLS